MAYADFVPIEAKVAIRPMLSEDSAGVLSAILSAADYGVLYTDLDHTALACNRAFAELWGVAMDDVVSSEVMGLRDAVRALIPDYKSWEENLSQVYADPQRTQEDELTLMKSPLIVIRRYTGPVMGVQGRVIGRLWTFRDITKEVRQRRLREAVNEASLFYASDPSEVFQHLVEAVVTQFPGALSLISIREGNFLEFRSAAGLPEHARDMKGNTMRDSYCQFAIKKGGPFRVEDATQDRRFQQLLPRKAGYTRYLGVPIYGDEGEIIGTLCLLDNHTGQPFEDDDERFLSLLSMRAGRELARERHYDKILALKELDLQRQRVDLEETRQVLEAMNDGFELLGMRLSTDEIISRQLRLLGGLLGFGGAGLVLPGEGAWHSESNARVSPDELRQHLGTDFVERRLSYSGELLGTLFLRGLSALDSGLRQIHLEALVEQVTLLLSTHLLQSKLADTTAELKATQDRLLQSEKLSVVGTLAAATAHDIKNIIAALSLDLAMQENSPELALMGVREHLDRFTVLTHRLLSYARPRMIARRDVNLQDLLTRVTGLVAAHAKLAGVRLCLQVPPELATVQADAHQLEHLFVNLLLNAIQAMESGGGSLDVSVERGVQAVVIRVSDTGKGVDQSKLEQIFEPFVSSRSEGFGLGLYSCRRIVEDHGGTIIARSRPQGGTQFEITLPTFGGNE